MITSSDSKETNRLFQAFFTGSSRPDGFLFATVTVDETAGAVVRCHRARREVPPLNPGGPDAKSDRLVPVADAERLCGTSCPRRARADAPHDWASVVAIPRGAPVRATLAYDIGGRLDDVTDSTLTIRVPADMHPLTISRARVVRVAVLAPKKTRWGWLGKPLAVGIVGGLVGGLVGAVTRDAKGGAISLGVFTASSIGGLYHFLSHYADHEWRVVYVRQ